METIKSGIKIVNARTGNVWTCILASKRVGLRKRTLSTTYHFLSQGGREMKIADKKLQGLLMAGLYKTK